MKKILLLCFQLISFVFLFSQNNSQYNPHDFYLPTFGPPAGNEYRSANGSPEPMYWQNSADYLIHATLSEKDTTVSGIVTITYTNNSPDKLDYVWLQLDQNMYMLTSKAAAGILNMLRQVK